MLDEAYFRRQVLRGLIANRGEVRQQLHCAAAPDWPASAALNPSRMAAGVSLSAVSIGASFSRSHRV